MKTICSIILAGVLLASCNESKDNVNPAPAPQAIIDEQTPQELTLGVYDDWVVLNKSVAATEYLWDLGNGETSTTTNIVLRYPKAGVYTVSLTAKNKDGRASIVTRTVKVHDFVINSVTLKNIYINQYANKGYGPADVPFPVFDKVNMWMEIKLGEKGKTYAISPGGDKDMPVIWKSPVVEYKAGDQPVLNFPTPYIALNIPALGARTGVGYGYGFNVYVQDASGTYLLTSSYWWGSTTINYDQGSNNKKFTMVTGLPGCEVDFHGTMELPQ